MSSAPPPGWYPEGPHLRWWDGAQWGPYAPPVYAPPPQTVEDRGKTLAVISHLGCVATFIAPLVVYLIERNKPDRNQFACHHACEGLNFQITFFFLWIGGFAVFIGSTIAAGGFADGSGDEPAWIGAVFLAWWLLMMVSMLANYVFSILGAVRAGSSVWWRYPVAVRLVGRKRDWYGEAVASGQLLAAAPGSPAAPASTSA